MEAACPSCNNTVEVGQHPKLGDLLACPFCHVQLEVVWLDPLELDWFIDEDFEDEEEYLDDDDEF